jgi:hypothetical protein
LVFRGAYSIASIFIKKMKLMPGLSTGIEQRELRGFCHNWITDMPKERFFWVTDVVIRLRLVYQTVKKNGIFTPPLGLPGKGKSRPHPGFY